MVVVGRAQAPPPWDPPPAEIPPLHPPAGPVFPSGPGCSPSQPRVHPCHPPRVPPEGERCSAVRDRHPPLSCTRATRLHSCSPFQGLRPCRTAISPARSPDRADVRRGERRSPPRRRARREWGALSAAGGDQLVQWRGWTVLLVRFGTRRHCHLGRCCIVSAVPHVRNRERRGTTRRCAGRRPDMAGPIAALKRPGCGTYSYWRSR